MGCFRDCVSLQKRENKTFFFFFLMCEQMYHVSILLQDKSGKCFSALRAWRLRQCLGIAVSHSSCGSRGALALPCGPCAPRPALTSRGFPRRHAPRLGCRPDASAARAGVRIPENGEPRPLCQAPVLPAADHAGLLVRPR